MSVLIYKALVLPVELFLPLTSETHYEQYSSQTYMKSRVTTNTIVYNSGKVCRFVSKLHSHNKCVSEAPLLMLITVFLCVGQAG